MPILGIGAARASLQNHPGPPRVYSLVHCRIHSCSFTVGDERRRRPSWEGFQFPGKVHTDQKYRRVVEVVPNLEPKCSPGKEAAVGDDTDNGSVEVESLGKDWEELDEKERLRRMRISKANKGMKAWNKGRKHRPETIQRIKERTRLAMQDPKIKIKMNISKFGRIKSKETRLKIAAGQHKRWQKYRETLACFYEWQNLIAEASRNGYAGQEELQWNSYQLLSEKLHVNRAQSDKMSPMPPEQRKTIGKAMAPKWADPPAIAFEPPTEIVSAANLVACNPAQFFSVCKNTQRYTVNESCPAWLDSIKQHRELPEKPSDPTNSTWKQLFKI